MVQNATRRRWCGFFGLTDFGPFCLDLPEPFVTSRCPNEVYYYAIWSIWSQLGSLCKLYWLLLSLASLYTLFSAVSIVRRLPVPNQRNDSPESSLRRLEARITNLRQVNAGMFFAFGALFFWSLPGAFHTLGLSRSYPINEYIGAFTLHFIFAANVFSVLLLLHCIQWFVSSRVLLCEVNTGK